jgi:hypothetical protein
VSDLPNDPADAPVETAQAAVEPTTSEAPVPWGDDFNPERAWKTITHLRDREKELEKQAKEFERLQQDDSAFKDFVSQRGYEIPDEEPEEPEYDLNEDPTADIRKTVDELRQWREQQEVDKALTAFNKDIDAKATEASVNLDKVDRDWLLQESIKGGFTTDAVNNAFSQLAERNKQLEQAAVERYLASKRAPTPPQPGKAGAPEFDPRDRRARQAHFEALVAAEQQP